MLDFSKLREISFDDRAILTKYLTNLATPSCEMSFTNLMMWQQAYQTKMLSYGDDFIFYSPIEQMIYFPRKKALSVEELVQIVREFQQAELLTAGIVYDVDNEFVAQNPEIEDFFNIIIDEDNFDYLYSNDKLASLSGSKLKKKRNLVNQFKHEYPDYFIELITPENAKIATDLSLQLNNELAQCDFLRDEDIVMEFAFQNFQALELNGFILYNKSNSPVGFTVFSKLNSEYADIHFEKARHDVKGASQILTQLLAEVLLNCSISKMNREQDLGNEGIRHAKNSLDPESLYRRVSLRLKD